MINQASLLSALVEAEASLPANVESLEFPGRKITFPVVLDDRWNREALEKYMRSIRDTAVYLPSNIEYLARNNGLKGGQEALKKLVETDWVSRGYIHAVCFRMLTSSSLFSESDSTSLVHSSCQCVLPSYSPITNI